MRILVVDDQQLNRTLLTFVLEAEGYEVQTAENGISDVREHDHSDPVPDCHDGSPHGVPPAGME